MSKSKKENNKDSVGSTSLRRTIINAPSTSRRSEEYDGGFNQNVRSKSSDSSPERKKPKYDKPVARGSESDIIFNKKELKKISITVWNCRAKPVISPVTDLENVTPIRRPESSDRGEIKKYEDFGRLKIVHPIERRYEGKRPIFEKDLNKSKAPVEGSSSNDNNRLDGSRRKTDSRSRRDSPSHRTRKSRRDSSDRRKHRRGHSSPSRRSGSSDSSSSSDERRKRQLYYISKREREERLRRDYEREMYYREKDRRNHEHRSHPHSNGGKRSSRSQERMKEEPSKDKASDHDGAIENYVGTQPQNVVRPMYPVRLPPRPHFMMRPPPMRPFVAPFVPAYPPHPVFFPPRPHPPMMLRPPPRPMRPTTRGFIRQ